MSLRNTPQVPFLRSCLFFWSSLAVSGVWLREGVGKEKHFHGICLGPPACLPYTTPPFHRALMTYLLWAAQGWDGISLRAG